MQKGVAFSGAKDAFRARAEALLTALDRLDDSTTADRFREQFTKMGWAGGADEIAALTAAIAAAAVRPADADAALSRAHLAPQLAPDSCTPVTPVAAQLAPEAVPAPSDKDIPLALTPFAPFLRTIQGWKQLLPATHSLLFARSWVDLDAAARHLFVDVLGYKGHDEDLTPRLGGRSAIDEVRVIGRFENVRILLVRLTRKLSDTRYSNTSTHYEACFRLAHHSILVSYEPGAGAVRLVYRQRRDDGVAAPWYRCIVGPWFLREANENLLTIMRRLSALAPRVNDDGASLLSRAISALAMPVLGLAEDWPSAPFETTDLVPGLPLHASSRARLAPPTGLEGLWWGLEAVLRNVFPSPVKYGEFWLDVHGLVPLSPAPSSEECWRRGLNRNVHLSIEFALRTWDTLVERARFTISVSLAVPDDDGWFWVEGSPYRWVPCVRPTSEGDVTGLADDDVEDPLGPETEAEADADTPGPLEDADEEIPDQVEPDDRELDVEVTAAGSDIGAALMAAVERRLWFLLRSVRRTLHRRFDDTTAGDVRAQLLSACGPGEPLPLLTPAMLRSMLRPVELAGPASESADAVGGANLLAPPPAWACLDLSAGLAPGEWAVIAGARVHPTGALAIPVGRADGRAELRVSAATAHEVNPRAGPDSTCAHADWWIHPSLARVAHLPVGTLADPARVAGRSATLRAVGLRTPSVAKATLAPWLAPRRARLRTHLDFPPDSELPDRPPDLLVSAGMTLLPGRPWVAVAASSFSERLDRCRSNLARLHAHLDPSGVEDRATFSLPWNAEVVVVALGASAVFRLQQPVGWRVWIEVVESSPVAGALVGDDGLLHEIDPRWAPESLPWDEAGLTPDFVVPSARATAHTFSGVTGEADTGEWVDSVVWVGAWPEFSLGSGRGAIDRLPRGATAAIGEEWPSLWLRIIAGAAGEGWSVWLSEMAQNHAIVKWAAGIGADETIASVATTKAPPITQVHRAELGLSSRGWRLQCSCGLLTGGGLLGASCGGCGTAVERRASPLEAKHIELPTDVLHPWLREAAAALLGLLPHELDQALLIHGPASILTCLDEAVFEPTVAATRRLALPRHSARSLRDAWQRASLRQMASVLAVADPDRLRSRLRLSDVGVPTLALVGAGSVLGQAQPAGSALLARYSELHAACLTFKLARNQGMTVMDAAAGAQLQSAVDRLFGASNDRGVDTLAGLAAHTNPWLRPSYPRVAAPERPAEPTATNLPEWWIRKAARQVFIDRWSRTLMAVVSLVPGWTRNRSESACVELAQHLLSPATDLQAVLAALSGIPAHGEALHRDAGVPEGRLGQLLSGLPQGVAREAVDRCFTGWWTGPANASYPEGFAWVPPESEGPSGWRRTLLRLDHPAWRRWPGVLQAFPDLGLSSILEPRSGAAWIPPLPATTEKERDGGGGEAGESDHFVCDDSTIEAQQRRSEQSASGPTGPAPESASVQSTDEDISDEPTAPGRTGAAISEITITKLEVLAWLRA